MFSGSSVESSWTGGLPPGEFLMTPGGPLVTGLPPGGPPGAPVWIFVTLLNEIFS